jgi:alkanesulfonate monooxygenase SsuD/methylene tetrahydromethanopterin reductase-like flavin-dependent oxidoreductase (luciferase family)
VNFDPIWSWPKPASSPHPPILVGGAGPRTLDRVIEYGDGWMPIGGRTGAILGQKIEELQEMAKAVGRQPIPVSVFGVPPSKEAIENYDSMGVDRCLFGLRPEGAEHVLPALKRYAEAAGL